MFSAFNSLLNLPLLTADMFTSFFTDKVSAISNQFSELNQLNTSNLLQTISLTLNPAVTHIINS